MKCEPHIHLKKTRRDKTVTISLLTPNMIRVIMTGRCRWLQDDYIVTSSFTAADDSECSKNETAPVGRCHRNELMVQHHPAITFRLTGSRFEARTAPQIKVPGEAGDALWGD